MHTGGKGAAVTCSEKEDSLPVEIAYEPSMEPVVEKAQQLPQPP